MKSLWNENDASKYSHSDLAMRVYTSRLLGANDELVMHGGGNTSVKSKLANIFGEEEDVLYVKGSGWDLATIEEAGFSPCDLAKVKRLGSLDSLSDTDMVRELKTSLYNPSAPTPSIETILHGLIPFKFVDHTHADAVVTISNTPGGETRIKEIYGDRAIVLPYVMPGFVLAKQVYQAIQGVDWSKIETVILLNHGIFTFSDDAKVAYENMVNNVSKAEDYLLKSGAYEKISSGNAAKLAPIEVAKLRKYVSEVSGSAMLAQYLDDEKSIGFSNHANLEKLTSVGPLTPDHIISTKRTPALLEKENMIAGIDKYIKEYKDYFERNKEDEHTCLDPIPRVAYVKGHGALAISPNFKRQKVISDITTHTSKCMQLADHLEGWKTLSEKDLFDLEYWELEQAKLRMGKAPGEFESKVAIVTGAASGIGKACAMNLASAGACVVALDINPEVEAMFGEKNILGLTCDLTKSESIEDAVEKTVYRFGGIDFLVSNAGVFPKSASVEDIEDSDWDKSMELNVSSHMKLVRAASAYLKLGIDPAIVFIASKNVPAPGPGAAAYSVAKAGLTQLARVLALELAPYGVRVNSLHPNQVFDTALWTDEVLKKRSDHYGLTVEEYKKNNLLKTEITSENVAALTRDLLSRSFSKTTGAQIPIDGGNERVI